MNIPTRLTACFAATVYLALGSPAVANSPSAQARRWAEEVHAAAGVSGGFVVHVGDVGERTAALRTCDRYYIQGLSPNEELARAARDAIHSLGHYGPVTVAHYGGERLPHIAELVNLVVVDGTDSVPAEAEIQRILAPHGVALIRSGGMANERVTANSVSSLSITARCYPKSILSKILSPLERVRSRSSRIFRRKPTVLLSGGMN